MTGAAWPGSRTTCLASSTRPPWTASSTSTFATSATLCGWPSNPSSIYYFTWVFTLASSRAAVLFSPENGLEVRTGVQGQDVSTPRTGCSFELHRASANTLSLGGAAN